MKEKYYLAYGSNPTIQGLFFAAAKAKLPKKATTESLSPFTKTEIAAF